MPLEYLLLYLVANAIVAGLAAYAGSYLGESAKQRATAEWADRLTTTTEQIKAAVSGDLWLQQKRWDLRRDVYTRLLESVDALDQYVNVMAGALAAAKERAAAGDDKGQKRHMGKLDEAGVKARKHLTRARRAAALGGVHLTQDARKIVDGLGDNWNKALEKSPDGLPGALPDLRKLVRDSQERLTLKARQDLIEGKE